MAYVAYTDHETRVVIQGIPEREIAETLHRVKGIHARMLGKIKAVLIAFWRSIASKAVCYYERATLLLLRTKQSRYAILRVHKAMTPIVHVQTAVRAIRERTLVPTELCLVR